MSSFFRFSKAANQPKPLTHPVVIVVLVHYVILNKNNISLLILLRIQHFHSSSYFSRGFCHVCLFLVNLFNRIYSLPVQYIIIKKMRWLRAHKRAGEAVPEMSWCRWWNYAKKLQKLSHRRRSGLRRNKMEWCDGCAMAATFHIYDGPAFVVLPLCLYYCKWDAFFAAQFNFRRFRCCCCCCFCCFCWSQEAITYPLLAGRRPVQNDTFLSWWQGRVQDYTASSENDFPSLFHLSRECWNGPGLRWDEDERKYGVKLMKCVREGCDRKVNERDKPGYR